MQQTATPRVQDFTDMLQALAACGVPHVVFGAQAVIAHGVGDRVTGDLDVYVEPSPEHAPRVLRAMASIGYPPRIVGADEALFSSPGQGVYMGFEPVRIDLHTEVLGVADPLAGAATLMVHGALAPVLSLEKLVASKRASGRAKDAADVARLLAL